MEYRRKSKNSNSGIRNNSWQKISKSQKKPHMRVKLTDQARKQQNWQSLAGTE